MKKILSALFLIFSTFLLPVTALGDDMRCDEISGYVKPAPNEVHIGPLAIGMPIGRIMLVRKDSKYSTVKFTKYWTDKGGEKKYATYEVHYQYDGTGDFFNKNVEFIKGEASFLPPRGIFYPLIWQPGKPEVKCGFVNLVWSSWCDICHVCFFERNEEAGDYGIEFAPTPWTDIKEVNVFDKRIKWFRYRADRADTNIPIDKIWEK